MPDPVTHHYFGTEVLSSLAPEVSAMIAPSVFERALQGPDPWSTLGFWGGKEKSYAAHSMKMHGQKAGAFLQALLKEACEAQSPETFSFLAGFLCHYCLDKKAHPYIICKSGQYDGTAETYPQRGGHVRMERSIDSYYIRRVYNKKPWRFSLSKNIFRYKKLPEALRLPLDRAFKQVYGWERGFDLFNRALRCERLFYRLMQDPLGLVQLLLRPISHGANNYCVYSYYRRETDPARLDYLNEKHTPWHHPCDPTIASTESFAELFAKAKEDAVEMILTAWRIVRGEQNAAELPFGDYHYSTGFACNDSRNENKPVYEPLPYKNYYQNQ